MRFKKMLVNRDAKALWDWCDYRGYWPRDHAVEVLFKAADERGLKKLGEVAEVEEVTSRFEGMTLYWSEGTWAMWAKSRLIEARLDCFRPGYDPQTGPWVLNPLHTFFIHIPETPEMLARLGAGSYLRQRVAEVSRSRITSYQSDIHPIDRVAARVAPEPRE